MNNNVHAWVGSLCNGLEDQSKASERHVVRSGGRWKPIK